MEKSTLSVVFLKVVILSKHSRTSSQYLSIWLDLGKFCKFWSNLGQNGHFFKIIFADLEISENFGVEVTKNIFLKISEKSGYLGSEISGHTFPFWLERTLLIVDTR